MTGHVDRWITLNGLRFHFLDWGSPDAPLLVLLHGFTGHARSWDHCPTLIVRGAESDVLSPQIVKRMLETLQDGRLVELPEAGHTVPGDQPEAFARIVAEFLAI